MNSRFLSAVFLASLLASAGAYAAAGKVTISSPADGATVSGGDNVLVSYEMDPGPHGEHLHLYLDGKHKDIIRSPQGKANVGKLQPGTHRICLAVNTKGHVPTGAEACISVTAK